MTPRLSDKVVPKPPEPFVERLYSPGILFREYPYHVARSCECIRKLAGEVRRG